MNHNEDTIVAIATPSGNGGIAVIRLSGPDALTIANKIWKGADLSASKPNYARYGTIFDPLTNEAIDDAIAIPFHGPASFTGENTVEFNVHGSRWIQLEIIKILINSGARMADHGEFTQRAFLNGKLDLAQAEGIADLIASTSRAAHRLALTQTRGGFSKRLTALREKLIEFASLLELELDFSEEDVEFADRSKLKHLASQTIETIEKLASSYISGRALKEGIPVVIAGMPNTGKSTLLNAILEDDKAIVSDIPGTTRDIIEDTIEIEGLLFRFYDTAGLRQTEDRIEQLGIDRTYQRLNQASIIIHLIDSTIPLQHQLTSLPTDFNSKARVITVLNKIDLLETEYTKTEKIIPEDRTIPNGNQPIRHENVESHLQEPIIKISAKTGEGIDQLLRILVGEVNPTEEEDIIVTNGRHYDSLIKSAEALKRAQTALSEAISADFIAQDIREALHHLSTITGAITTPDLLQTIFSRFCIGK